MPEKNPKRYRYGWKKVGKNCSNKLVPHECIKSYSIFALALAQPWYHSQHVLLVVVETISTICLSLLCFSFVWKYLAWMKPHTHPHTLESTQQRANKRLNLWMERGWGGRAKAKNTEKKRWINVRNFLLLQWLLGDRRHRHSHRHRHKYTVVGTWILFPCPLCSCLYTKCVNVTAGRFVWSLSPSPILSLSFSFFSLPMCTFFIIIMYNEFRHLKKFALIHTSKIKVEPYFKLMISLSKHWIGPQSLLLCHEISRQLSF